MISTELYDGQGLGNQLWVYAAVRSIAEHLGVNFSLRGVERFKGHEFLDIDSFVDADCNERQSIDDSQIDEFHEIRYYDEDLKYVSSGFDERVLSISEPTQLEGLFQSERYFFGHQEKLKRYIRLKSDWVDKIVVPGDTCILNVRGGEYKRHKNLVLPMSYWNQAIRNILEQTGATRFLVVTDDVKYAHAVFPRYEVLVGGVGDCYAALYNAKYLVLSNSSFAYFPVKTSNNSQFVIAPMHWARFGNPFRRWASPANLYDSWLWQDATGAMHSYQECIGERDATEYYYRTHYFLSTTPDQLKSSIIKQYVPLTLRKSVKRLLSAVFPSKIG